MIESFATKNEFRLIMLVESDWKLGLDFIVLKLCLATVDPANPDVV
jgi:hypothetical protein